MGATEENRRGTGDKFWRRDMMLYAHSVQKTPPHLNFVSYPQV
jgi:hypothetical protein